MNIFRWRQRKDEDLSVEIQSHLDEAIRDRIGRGEASDEARVNARREFGNVGLVKEVTREMWGWAWLERLQQDVQFGLRMLRKNPGFSLVAILTLSLGIGANTAIFSVINAVLLHPFAYPEAERIMFLSSSRLSEPNSSGAISYPNFLDWQKQQTTFSYLAAARNRTFNLTGITEAIQVKSALISPEAFLLLGVEPQLGRVFTAQDNQRDAARTVVLSHAFWQQQFAGAANVVGRQLWLDDQAYTVIGVMPPRFKFWAGEVWVPFGLFADEDFATDRMGIVSIFALGRLKPSVTPEQARAEFNVIAARLAAQYPETNQGSGVRIVSWSESFGRNLRPTLLVFMGAVGFVLLIACSNVASLLLMRTATREKELAIRAALGAGRGRLMRQLLLESLPLAALASLAGGLLANWGLKLILALSPDDLLPAEASVHLDARVLLFALGLTLLTTLLSGLLPALRFSQSRVNESLKDGSRFSLTAAGGQRMRSALVVLEVALSVVLLVGAGLLIKSFFRLQQTELGFKTESLLTVDLLLSHKKYTQTRQIETFFTQALEQLKALPGVEAAATMNGGPFSGWGAGMPLIREGHSYSREEMGSRGCGFVVTQGDFLAALGVPLVSGRSFTAQDTLNAPPVVVINQAAAEKFFPGENPLGQRIRLGLPDNLLPPDAPPTEKHAWLTVIGIVKNHQPVALGLPYLPGAFLPMAQTPREPTLLNAETIILRTAQDPETLISAVRQRIHELDPDQPILRIATVDARIADSLKPQRFNALLMSLFAAFALTLAVIGLYGVLAYTVVQRTHEIGIRLALGAQSGNIIVMIMKQGLSLTLLGMSLGLTGAATLTHLLERLLHGVSTTDAPTFIAIALLLLAVAALACWIPAQRATKVDPLVALRCD
ncbi:MAG: ABC transporter permease [Acidobacteria bacterium]|nr:ABC transporter permease [Acidobacteriota bacterium]